MCDSSQSSEDQNGDRKEENKGQVYKVSDGNEDSTGNWTRSHMCYILAKNLSIFCPHPDTM